jgi:hypothetical protein
MNTTVVGHYESDAPEWGQNGVEGYFCGTLAGSTSSDEVVVQPLDYQTSSMRPPQTREWSSALLRCLYSVWDRSAFEETAEERLEGTPVVRRFFTWSHLWRHLETDEAVEGGVFAPQRNRTALFSKKVKFRLADLPHRAPRITIPASPLDLEE